MAVAEANFGRPHDFVGQSNYSHTCVFQYLDKMVDAGVLRRERMRHDRRNVAYSLRPDLAEYVTSRIPHAARTEPKDPEPEG